MAPGSAVIINSHPSLTGISTGLAGSTAWHTGCVHGCTSGQPAPPTRAKTPIRICGCWNFSRTTMGRPLRKSCCGGKAVCSCPSRALDHRKSSRRQARRRPVNGTAGPLQPRGTQRQRQDRNQLCPGQVRRGAGSQDGQVWQGQVGRCDAAAVRGRENPRRHRRPGQPSAHPVGDRRGRVMTVPLALPPMLPPTFHRGLKTLPPPSTGTLPPPPIPPVRWKRAVGPPYPQHTPFNAGELAMRWQTMGKSRCTSLRIPSTKQRGANKL